jgi:hypothetical protein
MRHDPIFLCNSLRRRTLVSGAVADSTSFRIHLASRIITGYDRAGPSSSGRGNYFSEGGTGQLDAAVQSVGSKTPELIRASPSLT